MKIMVASDIHGSATYCAEMLEAFRQEKADRLLLLGDLLYHGPRNDLPAGYAPKEVIGMLNDQRQKILCVRGNCDTEVDQMVLDFPILSDSCLLYLGGHRIFAAHGHQYAEQFPPLQEGDVFLQGHTHIPICETERGVLHLNPGSVSIPKAGSARSYLLLEEKGCTWKTLDGTTFLTQPW